MKSFKVEENGTPKVLMLSDKAVLKIKEFMMYKRSEILENRKKWIDFLMIKGRKKATGILDNGGGARCCLGHGCYALGIKPVKQDSDDGTGTYSYDGAYEIAPDSFVAMVGLYDDIGSTFYNEVIDIKAKNNNGSTHSASDLAGINDSTNATPRQIGKYLLSVIEGGDSTPFRPLTDYPE